MTMVTQRDGSLVMLAPDLVEGEAVRCKTKVMVECTVMGVRALCDPRKEDTRIKPVYLSISGRIPVLFCQAHTYVLNDRRAHGPVNSHKHLPCVYYQVKYRRSCELVRL